MLPPQLNLVLEIEFADPADVVRGGQNSSVDFSIQNIRVLASQVTLDSALVESFNRVLLSGRSLVFSYPTVHTQVTSVPAGSTEFNVTVARAYSKLLGAFVTFRASAAPEGVTDLEHPGVQANGTSFLESQMQLGALQFPHYPAKDFAEHHHFLQVLGGNLRQHDSQFQAHEEHVRGLFLHRRLSGRASASHAPERALHARGATWRASRSRACRPTRCSSATCTCSAIKW